MQSLKNLKLCPISTTWFLALLKRKLIDWLHLVLIVAAYLQVSLARQSLVQMANVRNRNRDLKMPKKMRATKFEMKVNF